MKALPWLNTGDTITIQHKNRPISIRKGDANFPLVLDCIRARRWQDAVDLMDKPAQIVKFSYGNLRIQDGQILYKGDIVRNLICERIFSFIEQGLPFEPLALFLNRLMKNRYEDCKETCYAFVEKLNFPLTESGNCLSYKGVNKNWRDAWTDKVDNRVGRTPYLPWDKCTNDSRLSCASGYHAGSIEYAKTMAGTDGHVIIVEWCPSNVISVPEDVSADKIRVRKYTVVAEYKEDLNKSLYKVTNKRKSTSSIQVVDRYGKR